MAYWHERVRSKAALVIPPSKEGRTGIVVRRSMTDIRIFQAYFVRWEGKAGESRPRALWTYKPEGWFVLWPYEPVVAATGDEVREKALEKLPELNGATADYRYEKRPYVLPVKPTLLETITHTSHLAKATIFQYSSVCFEVRYFSYYGAGDYIRTRVPGCDAQQTPSWEFLTLADDIESAYEVAHQELAQIVEAMQSAKK